MSELFSQLGIEWKIIIAQIINFAILLTVLKIFAYKPIMKILNERRDKIIKDKENSEKIGKELEKISDEREKVLAGARKNSEEIIKKAEINSNEIKEKSLVEAKNEIEKLKISSEKEISENKAKLKDNVRKEIGAVVANAIEKSVGDILDEKTKKQVFEKSLQEINKGARH
jgi:F-type H+-transporting ATPase subunit b